MKNIRDLSRHARWIGWISLLGPLAPIGCGDAGPPSREAPGEQGSGEGDVAAAEGALLGGDPDDGTAPAVGVLAKQGHLTCTATQISCNAVLTAAHCLGYATNEDEQDVLAQELSFELSDSGTAFRVLGYKSYGHASGPDDIALVRIEQGCSPDLAYPPLAAAVPPDKSVVKTWGASCDKPVTRVLLPGADLLPFLGHPAPDATTGKRSELSTFRTPWPAAKGELDDFGDIQLWTEYPDRVLRHHHTSTLICKGDSGGPTFHLDEIVFVSSYQLVASQIFFFKDGTTSAAISHVGTGHAEVPKWRAQLLDKIAEWSVHCDSGESGSSGSAGSGSGSGSGSASDSGSGAGGGDPGSGCVAWSGSSASPPFTDEMPLSDSGVWIGGCWVSFVNSGGYDCLSEICFDSSGALATGSACSDSGSGDSSYSDSGSGCGDSGSGYGDSGSGCGDSGSGYGDSGFGDSSYSDSGSGYGDSGSGYGDSGSGGAGGAGGGG